MYIDSDGHFAITATMIFFGLMAIGTVVGGTTAGVISYNNGNRGWDLVSHIALGGLIGGVIGGTIGYFAGPSIAGLLASTGTISGGLAFAGGVGSTGGTIALSTVGKLALAGTIGLTIAGSAGISIMMSKHMPGMTNKPPFSWTTNQEGMDALSKFGGDANKAADYLMDKHFDNWHDGAGQARNAIKKWLDRVIRKMLGL